jgi:acetyltransferase-like isoleucine patch superfamily enzyme
MRKLRAAALMITALFPWPVRCTLLNVLFGWQVDRSARIGWSLFVGVRRVRLGPRARIGHFTVFRDLNHLELGADSHIGQWNWITAARELLATPGGDEAGVLMIGEHSAVTSRHYLDCTGGVTVGAFSTVAGVRSTIFTHQIDISQSRQVWRPVRIGRYCYIGSDVRITPGSSVPDRCVIGMGSVVTGVLEEPGMFYGGVPARPIKELGKAAYFSRKKGYVHP